ncbi:cytochrome P450 [Rhodocollybia butyracea]|uniref:Cytochrome P450 n=1 Tax=Rhodocollybia butyracea TaxID=206335 RepID=A0A9P5QBC0_9AGAR|nr:cytochrome P450 [Rhodocollybia butyracea]
MPGSSIKSGGENMKDGIIGDLIYIRKNNMLIVNHAHVARDLLDKHARIYSDRPMTNTMKLCGFDGILSLQKTGTGTSLIAELALESKGNTVEIEKIKAMGTISFLAGADTTMSSISSFLLTMTQHPDIQSKAQAEIARVIGRDRLPTFEDQQSLPYVESIYCKIMRMHPPLPLSVFHISIEDDFYRGYHIPKGCAVVLNIWAINRDPDVYSEPDKFMPECFLDSPTGPFKKINDIYAYGFGRRICAGRYMADNTVWLAIASVLATLNLHKAKDGEGNEVNIPGEYTKHFLRHPKPYQSSITPCDLQARELILATAMA